MDIKPDSLDPMQAYRLRLPVASLALYIGFAITLAALLGLGSALFMVSGRYARDGVQVGAWTVWPRLGGRDIDPYSKAIVARQADVPLGIGEGLMLAAFYDSDGSRLSSSCRYDVEGTVPPARFWTLTPYDGQGKLVETPSDRTGFTSSDIVRDEQNRFRISVSPYAVEGNWLPSPAEGVFTLVLRLYETPASAKGVTLDAADVPTITKRGCAP